MVVFFADSDMDVTKQDAEELGIKLISMPYCVDGKEIYPYIDFEEFDSKAFYDLLREGVLPSTCALNESVYIKYFEPVFAEGNDIFYIHFSRAMSGTFDSMDKALEKLGAKYPERRFYEIDTKGITTISLALFYQVMDLYNKGMSPEELEEWGKTGIYTFAMYFFADDLKFFKKSGRVSGLAATFGTILGVRPIIYMSPEGKMESIGKEKGRSKAIERLLSYIEEIGDHITDYPIYIGHTDAEEAVEEVVTELKNRYGNDINIIIRPVNPTAGAHCGPDAVGICFHAVGR